MGRFAAFLAEHTVDEIGDVRRGIGRLSCGRRGAALAIRRKRGAGGDGLKDERGTNALGDEGGKDLGEEQGFGNAGFLVIEQGLDERLRLRGITRASFDFGGAAGGIEFLKLHPIRLDVLPVGAQQADAAVNPGHMRPRRVERIDERRN